MDISGLYLNFVEALPVLCFIFVARIIGAKVNRFDQD
jgi:hypothetical protein